ncbi:MAG TPA: hypothetical protein VL947_00035 [Cytophagales bacterium]|nr:hypothetical protein [Cytophagales bacterium]
MLAFLTVCLILGCSQGTKNIKGDLEDYRSVIRAREQASSEKNTDYLGDLLYKVTYQVQVDSIDENVADGLQPWASIAHPKHDIQKLVGADVIVVPERYITILVDYPILKEYSFTLSSKGGFTRAQLLRAISAQYHQIYEEEESTAHIKTVPKKERKETYNRNETDGVHGIWGHDIEDLALHEILVYRSREAKIILYLNVYS